MWNCHNIYIENVLRNMFQYNSEQYFNLTPSQSGQGGLFLIFRLYKSMFFWVIEFHRTFSISYKYYRIMFIIIVFWLGCDRLSCLFFSLLISLLPPLYTYFLRLFLYNFSLLLFPCASVWENTRARVPH